MKRSFSSLVLRILIIAILSGAAYRQVKAQTNQTSHANWTVLVGGEAGIEKQDEGPAGAWQLMRFYPEDITINKGDAVIWKLNSSEPHP